jgi:Uma2 family endonuclease
MKAYLTPEQYLEIERKDEWKSEYYQAEMRPMPLPGEAHCLVVVNVGATLGQQRRLRPCRAYMSAMRLLVPATGLYAYPDVTVVFDDAKFQDESYKDTLAQSTVIVEVLTKSSEEYDRGPKFEQYRPLESLAEYLLISSWRVSAELFTRQPDGRWLLTAKSSPEDSLHLQSIDCRLLLCRPVQEGGIDRRPHDLKTRRGLATPPRERFDRLHAGSEPPLPRA